MRLTYLHIAHLNVHLNAQISWENVELLLQCLFESCVRCLSCELCAFFELSFVALSCIDDHVVVIWNKHCDIVAQSVPSEHKKS